MMNMKLVMQRIEITEWKGAIADSLKQHETKTLKEVEPYRQGRQ